MNKVYGKIDDFIPIRRDSSRTIVSYNLQPLEDNIHANWNEVYFYYRKGGIPTLERIKEEVIADINEMVKNVITEGFIWNDSKVWLTIENQQNYQSALNIAIQTNGESLPVTFKFGTYDDPVYVTFDNVESLRSFCLAAYNHIVEAIEKGWKIKDDIDWNLYQ